MPEQAVCPNCKQETEAGAVFCGNCGFRLVPAQMPSASTISQVYSKPVQSNQAQPLNPQPASANVPAYAVPTSHHKQHWGMMALAFGILGLFGGLLIPIVGLAFGVAGIVLISSSYKRTHTWLKVASSIACVLALLVSLAVWVYAVEHDAKLKASNSQAETTGGVATIKVTTPCYSLTFNQELNVNNKSGSCSLNAYNSSTFQNSSDVFKVLASQTAATTSNFDANAKQAIESDITKNLSGFQITKESSDLFGGSPAYFVKAYNPSTKVSFIEEAILHQSTKSYTDNLFVIVHGINGQSIDLLTIESSWVWND